MGRKLPLLPPHQPRQAGRGQQSGRTCRSRSWCCLAGRLGSNPAPRRLGAITPGLCVESQSDNGGPLPEPDLGQPWVRAQRPGSNFQSRPLGTTRSSSPQPPSAHHPGIQARLPSPRSQPRGITRDSRF
ncbi:hypothetical protein KIL84_002320 [Mauremys mutica]|uniref:Uncharacterized protein n=1 Tax=Mauremys mutica TaxID=74926 RepID=A0A9D3X759_9SAUR|nr:hypothetical protein KIL84_002320 [Mauremys mutica]